MWTETKKVTLHPLESASALFDGGVTLALLATGRTGTFPPPRQFLLLFCRFSCHWILLFFTLSSQQKSASFRMVHPLTVGYFVVLVSLATAGQVSLKPPVTRADGSEELVVSLSSPNLTLLHVRALHVIVLSSHIFFPRMTFMSASLTVCQKPWIWVRFCLRKEK